MSATAEQQRLTIVPVYWKEAKAYVTGVHRHHLAGCNGRFCIGVEDEHGQLRGVAVLGRTKARMLPHKHILEATRVATDGCPNACSALYGATCRLHKPHGYRKACTYILASESGVSLRAAGWKPVAVTEDEASWDRTRRPREDKHPLEQKVRWECRCSELPEIDVPLFKSARRPDVIRTVGATCVCGRPLVWVKGRKEFVHRKTKPWSHIPAYEQHRARPLMRLLYDSPRSRELARIANLLREET